MDKKSNYLKKHAHAAVIDIDSLVKYKDDQSKNKVIDRADYFSG